MSNEKQNNKPKKTNQQNHIRVNNLPADILPLPYHSNQKGTPQIDDDTQNAADIYDFLPDGIYDRYSD
ncbi:MAG: hypothetical protein IKJ63_08435 [Clostridia bacterium]|nr:hypothetical protein [Oscillospiraceae bacterium]MBQ3518048.1 hypothetical protein [Clostridia bacterium]MBR2413933.1 hypothetical protein [Clostridia bacterium]MBR3955483.1 hypothetical protein [Clostridia bacterium]